MPSGCWTAVLLLLLLLPAGTQAQSGDGDSDQEPRVSCTSHIETDMSSLTCTLLGGRSDNEDDEDEVPDGIEKMTMCYTNDWTTKAVKCLEIVGHTIKSRNLSPLIHFNVTVHLKSGLAVTKTVDLKKIVKPRRPQVWNVTFNQKSDQAVIRIYAVYHNQYLTVEKLHFQLLIWTTGSSMIQNISSSDTLKIDMQHLQRNSEYHVRVRAIPLNLQGTWSEWSDTFTVVTPADPRPKMYALIVCLVPLVVIAFFVVFFWKNKIFTYMWPSIPDPKHTLVQICKPNKGLLLNFKPEVFSALKVYPMEKREEQPCEEAAAAADAAQTHACSTQSCSCSRSTTSVSTEVSALLSRSSSGEEDGLQSTSPSPTDVLQPGGRPRSPQPEGCGGNEPEVFGGNQQEEAYVTMSSFYQIK